eukprot:TRINITY_DN10987_c0_g1_i1.p1 TRINITY_DN10987_c0_g1~~TRINITY_DN10987_c0_g1_i1.p1  ORF type:complete len:375 (-),score=44.36 TRINITY_DN10987_c0_g1_i1:17-1141(-)
MSESASEPINEDNSQLLVDTEDERLQLVHGPSSKSVNDREALWTFPARFETWLAPFDDPVTRMLQKPKHKIVYMWNAFVIGGLTCVEFGVAAPIVLFMIGLDDQALLATLVVLILAVFSQIPKRTIDRKRPYMVGRAEKRRTDATSSFPSRAVACAVCYSYVLCACVAISRNSAAVSWWMPLLIFVSGGLASFARINLGCHYMSDCVVGFVMGIASSAVGTGLYFANIAMCGSCSNATPVSCYSYPASQTTITLRTVYQLNWTVVCVGSALAALCVLLAEMRPMRMWEKSSHVLGMLLPCIVFRLTFTCQRTAGTALAWPHMPHNIGGYFVGLAVCALCTVIAIKGRKRFGLLVFAVVYVLCIGSMALWRMGVP